MAPYDKVRHASGKIENYYLKNLYKGKQFDIHLITFASMELKSEIDLDKYGISNTVFYYTWSGMRGKKMKLLNVYGKLNIWGKGAGLVSPYYKSCVLSEMKKLKYNDFVPDIVILQWTEIATMLESVKYIFPFAKIVMIEEDVSFLGHGRKAKTASGAKKLFLQKKAKEIKKRELILLNQADLIILNNHKDEKLIENDVSNRRKVWVWCPFYQTMLQYPRKKHNKDILFYGALSREENWKSAVWFLEKVWPHVSDPEARYVMIGNNPPEILQRYQSERVIVTGFVDEIYPYFEKSLCLAAPLVLGAGVKIKVLEGLSSGIPVLTNKIGIEGIPAENGKDFFLCESPEEYISQINKLLRSEVDWIAIEQNSKGFITIDFDFEVDVACFESKLINLL